MKCERCQESEATVQYVDIVEGQKTVVWLCETCAQEEGVAANLVADDEEPAAEVEGLTGFVGGLLGPSDAARPDDAETAEETCPECGFSSGALEEQGVLGCPACYSAFRERIIPLLRRYHRGLTHVGKSPHAGGPRAALRREMADLRAALERAVAAESYEEAASLRDRIRDRERELARLDADPPRDPAGDGEDEG